MKIYFTIPSILISIMLMAGCAPSSQQAQAPEPQQSQTPEVEAEPTLPPATPTVNPNVEVVRNMVERLNAGDVDGSLAFFAEDALSYFIGMPPFGMETYRGAEALRPTWEYCVEDHFKWEIEITGVTGDLVFVNAKTWLDFTRELGVAPNEFIEVYQVINGKITTYASTMTEAALTRFRPAFYEVVPPEPTAVPPSDTPVSEMTVTIANGTCTTDGPPALLAGEVTVTLNVEDQDRSLYALTLFNLDPGKDILDLMASTVGAPPTWADILLMEELGPGKSETYTFTLEKGPVYLVCWSQPPELPIGNAGPFDLNPVADISPTPERGESDMMFTFVDKQCIYEGPEVLPSGGTTVIMNMQGLDRYKIANVVVFFTLDSGYGLEELIDSFWMPSPPEWAHEIFKGWAQPGEVVYWESNYEAGPLYYTCISGESEETAVLVGEGGPLEVSP